MRVLLTDRFCDRAKSTSAQTDYFDESVSGLALRVSAKGVKAWTLHFTGPSGEPPDEGANEELAGIASSIKAFVGECCELGAEYTGRIDTLYNSYRTWCEDVGAIGWADRLPINQFSGKIRSAFPGQIDTIRPRAGNNPTRKRMFSGIRLRRGR